RRARPRDRRCSRRGTRSPTRAPRAAAWSPDRRAWDRARTLRASRQWRAPCARRRRPSVQETRRGGRVDERMAAAEALVHFVPEADRLLAVLPAEPHVAALALAEEVAQPEVEILDGHAQPFDGGELLGQRFEERTKAAAQLARLFGAVAPFECLGGRRLAGGLERVIRGAQLRPQAHDLAEADLERGHQRVGLGDGEVAFFVGHGGPSLA